MIFNEARPRRATYSAGREGRDALTADVISAGIYVHRALGPGLLESVYHACLCEEFRHRGLRFESEIALPIEYRGRRLEERFRIDLIIESDLLIEVKSVEQILPVHVAQVLTYLRLGGFERALLLNFNVARLTQGIRRISLRQQGG